MVDVAEITTDQFKARFNRAFPYFANIQYSATKTYNLGNEVFLSSTGLFYTALSDGISGVLPSSDATKWAQAPDNSDNYVQDDDIENAFAEAQAVFNTGLYDDDQKTQIAYLFLSAHFLASDLKESAAGAYAPASFTVASKSAGSLSESYDIPQSYKDSPILSQYTSTAYGMKFLSLTLPALVGNVGGVYGGAHA